MPHTQIPAFFSDSTWETMQRELGEDLEAIRRVSNPAEAAVLIFKNCKEAEETLGDLNTETVYHPLIMHMEPEGSIRGVHQVPTFGGGTTQGYINRSSYLAFWVKQMIAFKRSAEDAYAKAVPV